MKTLVIEKIILIALLFFSVLNGQAQSIKGRWNGFLTQESQNFDFRFYIDVKQKEEEINGVTLIVDYAGDSAKVRFSGTCLDGKISIKESKVVYSSKSNGLHWCIKSMVLKYYKNSNGEFLRGEWKGDCAPGTVVVRKEIERPFGSQAHKEMLVNGSKLILYVSDDRKVDGDIVTILLNGKPVLERYKVIKKPKKVKVKLAANMESQQLIFRAESEGDTPPNTALVVVKNKKLKKTFRVKSNLKSNDVIYIIPR